MEETQGDHKEAIKLLIEDLNKAYIEGDFIISEIMFILKDSLQEILHTEYRNKNKFIGFIIFILGVGLIVYEIIHSGIIQNWWNSLSVEVQATIIIVAILTIVLLVVGIASFLYIKFLRHLGRLAGEKVNKKINNKSYSNKGDIRK